MNAIFSSKRLFVNNVSFNFLTSFLPILCHFHLVLSPIRSSFLSFVLFCTTKFIFFSYYVFVFCSFICFYVVQNKNIVSERKGSPEQNSLHAIAITFVLQCKKKINNNTTKHTTKRVKHWAKREREEWKFTMNKLHINRRCSWRKKM